MRLIIIPIDKKISIDGISYNSVDVSWVPLNVHALQWYDTYGEIEYTDGTPNEIIEEQILHIKKLLVSDFNSKIR
jgi:hypothetical protein